MEINKVLLIQKLAENKMRYILELTGMPDFVADENGDRSKVIHCTAFMEVETNIFDDSKSFTAIFLQLMSLIEYIIINSILLRKICLLLI